MSIRNTMKLLQKFKSVHWLHLRKLQPRSRVFGFDRGQPIDRYYIEKFLSENSAAVRGHVLEIGGNSYTKKYGMGRVSQGDVLHATEGNPLATIVGDLATGRGIPKNAFDCMILTQTLLCIYDIRTAVANAYHALKPGGVILATVPGISQISRYDMDRWGDYWRFTSLSARRLFEEAFQPEKVEIVTFGNVLTATAFLQGIPVEKLRQKELDYHDTDYELLITIKAGKSL